MLVWLVDDDKTLLETSDKAIKEEATLNITLKTIHSFKEFEDALFELESDEAVYPSLIFLDLKFKSVEKGYQALDLIKHHERMSIRSIPTIMFSSTVDAAAVKKTYRKSANAYIEKGAVPSDTFRNSVKHWNHLMKLPKPEASNANG